MRFRFCGNGDCPDWVLAEINTLSRLSSVKLKSLGQIVAQGIIEAPIDMIKVEKIFADSKLDVDVDLKACVACISYIITSTTRYNCDYGALFSELQQLGLPREHSLSLKKVVQDNGAALAQTLKVSSLTVNKLQNASVDYDTSTRTAKLDVIINDSNESVVLSSCTVNVLLENLKQVRSTMEELLNSPYS
ncbi:hypothetical protein RN001_015844 [Aquatica leii]|uniref:COMM domain-containing protein 4 n=1 Tax=Aquatica leii TaxID=1421715 RepID=A0AAN7NTR2_9COLE|nr:hypothetical protein RN001_015844 [Aquatica leii]